MNAIEKLLRKLRKNELNAMMLLMLQIKKDYTKVPSIKALVGRKNYFRVRLGNYRIIFVVNGGENKIVKISIRDESTYKNI